MLICEAIVFCITYGNKKSWTKPVQIAAVGKAEKTTSNVHDIADAHYLSVFLLFYEISYVPICMTE